MSWGRLDDTFHDEPKFYRLAERLGISFVEAAGHVAILWSWAHRHAPDGDLRDFDVHDIERAAKWTVTGQSRQPGAFVTACADERIQLLDVTEHGYVIHRFMERAEASKAAKRKAAQRERERVEKEQRERSAPVLGRSRDGHEKVTEDREDREDRTESEKPPARSFSHLGSRHPEVAGFEAAYHELFPGSLALDDKGRVRAAEIIRRCTENAAKWRPVLEAFSDPRWTFANGSLDWLRDHLGEVVVWIAKGKPAKKPSAAPFAPLAPEKREVRPGVEETKARLAEQDRQRRQVDPEAAKGEVAKILAKLT